ncbi:mitochondrial Complex I (CI) NADH:ubiquinone oxidoreductase subunit B8/NI8M/NDUFA2 [Andalucia godoyi]|uniref:Mitochondrial Complex I (CI) NADH:ubiquinone oxidoreductase subunit B8/NI8M/NDUFA2 n=1 Tax=Andalucia godoyi TaxID=505711 RepID=A0A8K0AGJ1_ANDGO|nr:mitochondrial Complex I (CI) NADH:ubiquinone oxidoreductase subunit B8/NI8M/NDUFA2 [Andalucia godoyi]|eukprot:ANDGO_00441.mRNA.1 mitochondrial Complex I (CI) NADH:ubiquinone oxidoreductase subunit B8/NI8M/NDUFA2
MRRCFACRKHHEIRAKTHLREMWKASLSKKVLELRILYDPSAASSSAVRGWLSTQYAVLKTLNPSTMILVRESTGVEPKVIVRADHEQQVLLSGLSESQIDARLKSIVEKAPELPRPAASASSFRDII